METFKTIITNPDYQISNLGQIKSLGRKIKSGKSFRNQPEKIIYPSLTGDGYLRIELKNPKKKYLVHRLVALCFVDNPSKYPIINHINKVKTDNKSVNLEWCTNKYNCNYDRGKRVKQIDVQTGKLVNKYHSISYAYEVTGIQFKNISKVCHNERQSAGGFYWEYY